MKLLPALLALYCYAQTPITAQLKPESLKNSSAIFGKGRDIGVWSVRLCSESQVPLVVPRARVLMAFPAVRDIDNKQAADILTRKAARDPRSIIGNNGDATLGLASGVVALAGIAANSKTTGYVGAGMTGLQIVFRYFKSSAPNPTSYLASLLPEQVPLAPLACSEQYFIVANLTKNAATQTVTINIPQVTK